MTRKTDPRVIRTLNMLRDALIGLILERGYDSLTIGDITDRAGLRRATFYLHFKDKEELLLALLKEMFESLVMEIEKLNVRMLTPEAEFAIHKAIFRHAQANADLYRSIFASGGSRLVTRHIHDYLARRFIAEIDEHRPNIEFAMPVDVLANYVATIKLNLALWWLDQGMPYSPEEMAKMCTELTLHGVEMAFRTRASKQA
jgi:AcrR family transcriptional regulator